VLSYALVPPALAALRRQDPERDRPFRLPLAEVLAPLGFIVANLIVYWSGWDTDRRLFIAIAIGFIVLAGSQLTMPRDQRVRRFDARAAIWFPPYIGGMAIISWLGQYDGRATIPFWWDIVVVAVFSLAIYAIALTVRLGPERTQELIGDLTAEAEEERAALGEAAAH
jgi:amino acid transporter